MIFAGSWLKPLEPISGMRTPVYKEQTECSVHLLFASQSHVTIIPRFLIMIYLNIPFYSMTGLAKWVHLDSLATIML